MSTDLNEQAYEQQLQWSLSEAEGGESPPDVTDKVLAAIEGIGQSVQAPVTRSRWLLTAAIVTLGVAALFGVHHFSQQQGDQVAVTPSPSSNPPTQDPRPKHVRKHLVRDAKEIADLPSDARSVNLWQLSDDDFAAVVERCPKLEEVAASTSGKPNPDLTDRVFTTASKLTNLRKLQLLQVSQVTGEGIEQLAFEITSQMLEDHVVDDHSYAAGVSAFGEECMIELVLTVGYYCLICHTLNTFQVPLEPGMEDPFLQKT